MISSEKIHYHNISEFDNDFDVKSIDEELNICDRCGIIVNWHDEMYWQGEDWESYHYCLLNYEAVCDDCFFILSKQKFRTFFNKVYLNLDYYFRRFLCK